MRNGHVLFFPDQKWALSKIFTRTMRANLCSTPPLLDTSSYIQCTPLQWRNWWLYKLLQYSTILGFGKIQRPIYYRGGGVDVYGILRALLFGYASLIVRIIIIYTHVITTSGTGGGSAYHIVGNLRMVLIFVIFHTHVLHTTYENLNNQKFAWTLTLPHAVMIEYKQLVFC